MAHHHLTSSFVRLRPRKQYQFLPNQSETIEYRLQALLNESTILSSEQPQGNPTPAPLYKEFLQGM